MKKHTGKLSTNSLYHKPAADQTNCFFSGSISHQIPRISQSPPRGPFLFFSDFWTRPFFFNHWFVIFVDVNWKDMNHENFCLAHLPKCHHFHPFFPCLPQEIAGLIKAQIRPAILLGGFSPWKPVATAGVFEALDSPCWQGFSTPRFFWGKYS